MFKSIARWAAVAVALYFLLFFGLTDVGLLGPDEPRYASIGREMALSGDWVTPRLWGEAWFEKPALLYWMTGVAFRLGLSDDLAPRLPVAVLSLLFLLFFHRVVSSHFGAREGWCAMVVLATSTGWFAFSHVGVTDIPLAVCYGAAMLVVLGWIEQGDRRSLAVAGVLLGLAMLAKGLVPAVLAAPVLWFGRRRLSDVISFGGIALLAAAPWYVLCALENGPPFLQEFFVRHHFGRFSSGELQHVQPFWFYIPVLMAGLLPWTPALVLLGKRRLFSDRRLRFLGATVIFAFVFFSASTNKLPGYLLPLFPPLAALLGVALARTARASVILALAASGLVVLPLAAGVLPDALRKGLPNSTLSVADVWTLLPVLVLTVVVWWLERRGLRSAAVAAIGAGVVLGAFYLKLTVFPVLDREVSARALWREVAPVYFQTCVEPAIHRSWRYGLNYYSLEPLPACPEKDLPYHVVENSDGEAALEVQ